MRTIVLDASVVLKWILLDGEDLVDEAKRWHDRIASGELRAVAPESILVEIANVMFWKKRFKKKEITSFLSYLGNGIINVVPYYSFEISELLDIMDQYDLSIYDAYYVSLAKKNDCKVITLDKRILKISGLAMGVIGS